MRKFKYLITGIMVAALLAGCGKTENPVNNNNEGNVGIVTPEPTKTPSDDVADPETNITEPAGDFSLTVDEEKGGAYTVDGSVYTITDAGTYVMSGALMEGRIVIAAGEESEVSIELSDCKISCSTAAPIMVESAKEVKIKSIENTTNQIIDERSALAADAEAVDGNAAIYADCDLSFTGKGVLVVKGGYNNGIQSKDKVSIKNVTLKVEAVNNAIKGNEEVNIESGELFLVTTNGDGIKTSDTGLTKKGNQKGNITISGGSLTIYAKYDGIDAAFDLQIETEGKVSIYTGKYNTYSQQSASTEDNSGVALTGWWGGFPGGGPGGGQGGFGGANNKNTESAKALKAGNSIIINNGEIVISTEDDGMNAGTDDAFESGVKSAGEVTINGGTITITAGDDGIHADQIVTINNGNINVVTSYEGIEGNVINMNGGNVYVYATDDGLNASSGNTTPLINITGGYLDVTTPSGDTDAIDSNGNITMTGGIVLVKGGNSQGSMAGSVDTDGKITITGGTIVALGGICELPTNSQNAYASAGTAFSAGSYTIKDKNGKEIFAFNLTAQYQSVWVCSDALTTGGTYTIYNGNSSVLTWTQTAGTMGSAGGGFGGGQGGFGGGQGGFGGRPGGGR